MPQSDVESELTKIRTAAADIARLRASVLRELEAARQTRLEVQQYQQQVIARAQSEAQKLILHTRLSLQKEVEETKRVTGQQMQKVLGDMRILRITAQEELRAQRAFTSAARIKSLVEIGPAPNEDAPEKGEAVSV
jgi:dsDNA-specific endonuclease/ATPase MutS2